MVDNPITRKEKYLAKLTGSYAGNVPDPITRVEKYLYDLCQKGISGLTPEEIENAVNKYLKENPVQPGATTEQAQQIEQNKTDIASLKTETDSLKEDLSNKITKFYASNQGETHLADSDSGKIMDMMLYGKSEQKKYLGKNLLKPHAVKSVTSHGVTCTYNTDGSVSLKGTAENNDTDFYYFGAFSGTEAIPNIDKTKTYTLSGTGTSKIQLFTSGFGNSTNGTNITGKGTNIFYVMYRVPNGTTVDATIYPQLELGAEATSYEPYTGGIPSPNPDYPQEIKSVVNPTVKVCGKNLLNYKETIINSPDVAGIEFVENGFRIYTKKDVNYCYSKTYLDFSKLRIGETYTLSANLLIVKGVSRLTIRNRANTIIADSSNITESGTYKISFTLTDQMHYVSFFATFDAVASGDVIVTNIQLEKGSEATSYEPYHEQTVTLPYDLYGVKVPSGGNVTIGGQQYMSDYFDVERGKLVRMAGNINFDNIRYSSANNVAYFMPSDLGFELPNNVFTGSYVYKNNAAMFNALSYKDETLSKMKDGTWKISDMLYIKNSSLGSKAEYLSWFNEIGLIGMIMLAEPEEIDLTSEEVQALKALATYYPTTNISVNSEQLDGYTVFNYPISMENGWNYVKQQIGDTRDYIYDMDARAQDTDLQAAEAYVNSEYAVALTELEV